MWLLRLHLYPFGLLLLVLRLVLRSCYVGVIDAAAFRHHALFKAETSQVLAHAGAVYCWSSCVRLQLSHEDRRSPALLKKHQAARPKSGIRG